MISSPPSICPTIRYDAAIRFLTTAFALVAQEADKGFDGFEEAQGFLERVQAEMAGREQLLLDYGM